jgi:hypothetical protein
MDSISSEEDEKNELIEKLSLYQRYVALYQK